MLTYHDNLALLPSTKEKSTIHMKYSYRILIEKA